MLVHSSVIRQVYRCIVCWRCIVQTIARYAWAREPGAVLALSRLHPLGHGAFTWEACIQIIVLNVDAGDHRAQRPDLRPL